ncbi:MAG: pyridoxine 5'-phosphate synthase [Deltaproteobacteria bacterium]|nr:pyridoxine 5'-phosphate synthase [Deltaproteobacteria bacterium]
MTIALHVNIDHVATLRQARGATYPDPVEAAMVAERAGAHGITAHLREDRRHVNDRDVRLLRQVTRGVFNLEMAATEEMLAIAREVRPHHVTLVPERRQERTTEGGLDVLSSLDSLKIYVTALHELGIKVSMFIAADEAQIAASEASGADQIELHTGDYAHATGAAQIAALAALARGARLASQRGLRVAAGHGLTLANVGPVAAIASCVELNIGHAIVSDAVIMGFAPAVQAMLDAMRRAR